MYLVTNENLKFNINFILKIKFNNNFDLISAVKFPGNINSIIPKNKYCA
ncbi:hypothetical protein SAMN05660445_01620 [Salegentibacter salarius]|nr:hypothetical protein SAMN05660445_01620 [Salegentibacter salarius]